MKRMSARGVAPLGQGQNAILVMVTHRFQNRIVGIRHQIVVVIENGLDAVPEGVVIIERSIGGVTRFLPTKLIAVVAQADIGIAVGHRVIDNVVEFDGLAREIPDGIKPEHFFTAPVPMGVGVIR